MTFKRPQLRKARTFVNAISALAVIFSLAACGGKKSDEQPKPDTTVDLPVIWTTASLVAPVRDIGISSGYSPLMLVAMDNNQVQMFDLDGERLTEPSDLGVKEVSDGYYTDIENIRITLFPAIDNEGSMKLLGFNDVMSEPLALSFPEDLSGIGGLCTKDDTDGGILELAYWTESDPKTLEIGTLSQDAGELVWQLERSESVGGYQTQCLFETDGSATVSTSDDAARLFYDTGNFDLALNEGGLTISSGADRSNLYLRPGLSVEAPQSVFAIAAASNVSVGSYPKGLIAVAGPWEDGDHRVVYVDPSPLLNEESEG